MNAAIVFKAVQNGHRLTCNQCGDTYLVNIPCELSIYIGILQEFAKVHALCGENNSSHSADNGVGEGGVTSSAGMVGGEL